MKRIYDYADLKDMYSNLLEEKKKLEDDNLVYYYQSREFAKKIKALEEDMKIKDRKIKELKIINLALYDKIYNRSDKNVKDKI